MVLEFGCGIASADELSDGIKAWERQDYAQAQQIFSKLAKAGNAEAQRQLGEMIGFGEGVPETWPAQAQSRMSGPLTRLAAEGRAEAEAMALAERNWVGATEKKVVANNAIAQQMVEHEKMAAFSNLSVREDRRSFAPPAPSGK
jgi:TPR repeat protein